MNERNEELIVDLIGGRLSPDEEQAALVRMENDAALRAEYESQMSVVSRLGASSSPSMTPDERSKLHAALRRQLHLDDDPVPVVAAPSRWQRWWAPVGGLAVAAAVVLGAVVVLPGTLSGDDSDGAFEMASAVIATTVPTAPLADALASVTESPETDQVTPQAEESVDAGGMAADGEAQPTTTAAAYEAAAPPADLPYLVDVDLDALESELASDPESLRNAIPAPSTKSLELGTPLMEACLDTLRIADTASSISPIATTTYEDTEAVVVSVSPPEGDPFLAIFAVDSCEELASTQG